MARRATTWSPRRKQQQGSPRVVPIAGVILVSQKLTKSVSVTGAVATGDRVILRGYSRKNERMQVWRMRNGIYINLKNDDRRRLTVLARDRNATHKHVWRAEIVLLSADGVGTNEIMRRNGKSKTCVWRWQERFMQEGYDGLLRDKNGLRASGR